MNIARDLIATGFCMLVVFGTSIACVAQAPSPLGLVYLEDRAAKFLLQKDLILANADFRVFNDMIERWSAKYMRRSSYREGP